MRALKTHIKSVAVFCRKIRGAHNCRWFYRWECSGERCVIACVWCHILGYTQSGEKGVKHASAPPPLKCFFPSAGLILTVEMNILLIFTQHQVDTAVCPTSTLDFSLSFSCVSYPLFVSFLLPLIFLLSAPGLSGSGTSGGVPDMGGSIYSKTQVRVFFF